MAKIDISYHVHNPLWKVRLRPYTKTIKIVLETVVEELKLKDVSEVSVVLADDKFVKELNSQYRGKHKPTNVLSFPSGAIEYELGDIILALETIEKEAKEQNKTFRSHSIHMLVHGFLHLLGYDHLEEKQAEKMEKLEIKILKKLNVSNPYL